MGIVGIDVGVEGPGVDDQRDGAISEARISSIRSETSLWPLRPLAAALNRWGCQHTSPIEGPGAASVDCGTARCSAWVGWRS